MWRTFRPLGGRARRQTGGKMIMNERRDSRSQIPSWSWLAWRGLAVVAPTILSLVSVFRWRNGQLKQLCAPGILSLPTHQQSPAPSSMHHMGPPHVLWDDESEWTVGLDDLPEGIVLPEDHIVFWAWVIPNRTGRQDEQAIIGYDPRDFRMGRTKGFFWTLEIIRNHHVAQRVASDRFEIKDSSLAGAVKKLIILE